MDFVLGFDGGNAKQLAMYGYILMTSQDDPRGGSPVLTVVAEGYGKCHDQEQTNNVAEWSALMYGLMAVLPQIVTIKREHEIGKLYLHGDSQLVLYQLSGKYGCTKAHLRYYLNKCQAIVKRIEQEGVKVITDWEKRERNSGPDSLTHRARQRYLEGGLDE